MRSTVWSTASGPLGCAQAWHKPLFTEHPDLCGTGDELVHLAHRAKVGVNLVAKLWAHHPVHHRRPAVDGPLVLLGHLGLRRLRDGPESGGRGARHHKSSWRHRRCRPGGEEAATAAAPCACTSPVAVTAGAGGPRQSRQRPRVARAAEARVRDGRGPMAVQLPLAIEGTTEFMAGPRGRRGE